MKLEQLSDPKNIFFCHTLLFFFATTSVWGGDSPPTLSNDVEDSILSVAVSEGTLAVVTLSATDLDGDSVTFDLSQDDNEAEDADLFDLNTSSGVLTFINAPSYEEPKDSDEDNVYVLLISYTDGFTPDESVEVRVTVTTTFVYLTVKTQGFGTVSSADEVTYQQGDTVSLTAEPEGGNQFIQWTGDAGDASENDNPLSLMMDQNKSVTAVFAKLNAVPFFTNILPGKALEISVNENQAEVLTLTADDDDNDSVTFVLSGTDAGLFDLNTTTGVLTFLNSPDYESPADGDFDNIYELEVIVSDAQDTSPSSPLRITIQDQSENFTLTVVVEGEGTV
ncbi:MAG: cadherin domain-containing protein, partial [Opitutales bacterium]